MATVEFIEEVATLQVDRFQVVYHDCILCTYRIEVIHLHRGKEGLGVSIVGGKGSTHGDLPIFINQVFKEGAAGKDGRLRKGDEVLSVNGISFADVTHEFAANTLKYLKGDVSLTILRTD